MNPNPKYNNIFETAFVWMVCLGIPLIVWKRVLDPALLPKYIALSAALLVFSVYLLFAKKQLKFQTQSPTLLSLLLFLLVSGIGIFYSPLKWDGVFEWSKLLLLAVFVFLLMAYGNFETLKNHSSKAFTVLGIAISVWGITGFIKTSQINLSHNDLYKVVAAFGHKNIFSEILFLTLPFSLYQTFGKNKIWKLLGAVSFVPCLGLIVVLMSRAVWLATLIGGIATLVLYIAVYNVNRKRLVQFAGISLALLMFVAAMVFGYSKLDSFTTIKNQGLKTFNLKYGTSFDRIELWKKSSNIVAENPVFGGGTASWKINILKQGNENLRSEDQMTFYQRPHNDLVWVAAENGFLGLACCLLFVVMVFRGLVRKIRYCKTLDVYGLMLFFGFSGYLVFSLFSFPRERMEHLVFVSIIAAMAINHKQKSTRLLGKRVLLVVPPLLIAMIILGILRTKGEMQMKSGLGI